jgi:hypothetical protein
MSRKQNVPADAADGPGNLLALALLALIVGAAVGFVGGVFRVALEKADRLRDTLIAWANGEQLAGFLIVVVDLRLQLWSRPRWFGDSRRMHRGAASLTSRRC